MGVGYNPLHVVLVEPIFEWSKLYLDVLGAKQSIKRKPSSAGPDISIAQCKTSVSPLQ